MQNIDSGEQKECRVVYMAKVPMGPTKVAVEFTRPAPLCGACENEAPAMEPAAFSALPLL